VFRSRIELGPNDERSGRTGSGSRPGTRSMRRAPPEGASNFFLSLGRVTVLARWRGRRPWVFAGA